VLLAALYPQLLHDFDVFGIIKETGVDNVGLMEFHDHYFNFPLYRDASYAFYQALGDDAKVPLEMIVIPLSIYTLVGDVCHYLSCKKGSSRIMSNKGESLVPGGIIIFQGNTLEPVAMLQEELGVDLPVLDIVQALNFVRQQQQQQQRQQQRHNEQNADATTATANSSNDNKETTSAITTTTITINM
jgi:hypothetical protein